MKKFSTLLLIFACCSLAAADVTQTLNAANQCVQISASGQGTIGIAVAGTWSATLQPEAAVGGQAAANTVVYPVGSTTSQSTIAANGTFTSPVSGLTTFLLCVSAYTSGSATVVLTSSQATSSKTASGGGSGTVTSITAGTGLTGGTITGSGTIALSTPVGVAIGGTGAATLTGPIKGNGTSALTAAAASDIVGLFSTCSGTQYLGADGACHAAGTGSGTVNTGTLGYTAGYPSSSTAVSAYPVRGVITNPFSGADWCLRAQTAQGASVGGVGAIAVDATAEIANASSGQLTCSVNPFLANQIADLFYVPNGITQMQQPFQVRSSSVFVQGGGRGGTGSNNTGPAMFLVCNNVNSSCTPPAGSPFATGGFGSSLSITWNVNSAGRLDGVGGGSTSVINNGGTGYYQPVVTNWALGIATCSAGVLVPPAEVLHTAAGVVIGGTQVTLAGCTASGTLGAGTLTATISQGPLFTNGNGNANYATGLGPMAPVAAFSVGANDLVNQTTDTGFTYVPNATAGISYNEDVRLKEFNINTGGTPGIVGLLDTATQNMTVKDGIKISASTNWQLMCGGGSQQAQNGCNYKNIELSYPGSYGCQTPNASGQQSNPANGTMVGSPIAISSWSVATSGVVTITLATGTSTVLSQGQPFIIYGALVGTSHSTNINTGVNNGLGTNTINGSVYINMSPNQATNATTFFYKGPSIAADQNNSAGGYVVFESGGTLFWGNLVPSRTNQGAIVLASSCVGNSNTWTLEDGVVSTSVASSTTLTVNLATGGSCGGTTPICPTYIVGQPIRFHNFTNAHATFLNASPYQYATIATVTGSPTTSFTVTLPASYVAGNYTTATETTAFATPPVWPVGTEISGQASFIGSDWHTEGYDTCYSIGDIQATSDITMTNIHCGTNDRNVVMHISNMFGEPTRINLTDLITGGAGANLLPLYARYLMVDDGNSNSIWSANNLSAVTQLYSIDYSLDGQGWPTIHANCLATHVTDANATVQDVQNGDCYYNGNHYKIVAGVTVESDSAAGLLTATTSLTLNGSSSGSVVASTPSTGGQLNVNGPVNATTGFQIGGAATNTHCLVGNGTNYVDTACPSGFSNPMTTLGDIIYENATPAAARLAGPTVDNSSYVLNSTPVSGAAVAPVWTLPGVPVDTQSSATPAIGGDNAATPDRVKLVRTTNNTTSTATSLPQAGSTHFANNLAFVLCNPGTVVNTITPATSTVNGNATAVMQGQPASGNPSCAFFYSDNTNYFAAVIPITDANGKVPNAGLTNSTFSVQGVSGSLGTNINVETATAGQVAISGGSGSALTGAADLTYSTHTFSGISTTIFDLSAATGTAAFKVPQTTTNTATAAGVIDFDTTNKNFHGYVNGADSLFLNIAAAPTTGDLASYTIASGNTLAADAGFLATNVVRKDTTNAGAAAMTLNMNASTTAPSVSLPAVIGGTILSGTSTANLSAPAVISNLNSTNNNTSITLGITAPGTSTGQTVLNVNGASTGGDLLDLGTGGTWASGVLSGQTIVASVTPTGVFEPKGTTATFLDFAQGSTSASVVPCNAANSKCFQAPTALTANVETLAPATAQGVFAVTGSAATTNEMYSGDANHSTTVSWSTATSVGSTSLCSTTFCPVGTYRISGYIDVTTACTTTGSYIVNLIYTDDTTVSKTVVVPFYGLGFTTTFGPTAVASTLVPTATTDYGSIVPFTIRTTGAASINYSTTATACGTGGPGVGKLYLVVEPIQ